MEDGNVRIDTSGFIRIITIFSDCNCKVIDLLNNSNKYYLCHPLKCSKRTIKQAILMEEEDVKKK